VFLVYKILGCFRRRGYSLGAIVALVFRAHVAQLATSVLRAYAVNGRRLVVEFRSMLSCENKARLPEGVGFFACLGSHGRFTWEE